MINTEPGKRLGRIYIPKHYNEDQLTAVTSHLLLILETMEHRTYNWEILGTSFMFEPLDDMETVPTYDLKISWVPNAARVQKIVLTRVGR